MEVIFIISQEKEKFFISCRRLIISNGQIKMGFPFFLHTLPYFARCLVIRFRWEDTFIFPYLLHYMVVSVWKILICIIYKKLDIWTIDFIRVGSIGAFSRAFCLLKWKGGKWQIVDGGKLSYDLEVNGTSGNAGIHRNVWYSQQHGLYIFHSPLSVLVKSTRANRVELIMDVSHEFSEFVVYK